MSELSVRRNTRSKLQKGRSKDGSFKRNAKNVKSNRRSMKSKEGWIRRKGKGNGKSNK